VGSNPQGVATGPAFGVAVVANEGDNTATIINTADFTQPTITVAVGGEPIGVAISPIDGTAFITNSSLNSDSVSSFATVGAATTAPSPVSTTAGVNPVAIAVDPVDLFALVVNAGGGNAMLLDISQSPPVVTATATIASQPTGVAYDPVNDLFIVAASLSNSLSFLNPTTQQISTARVGINPSAVAFNYLTNTAVTVNVASGTISVMDVTNRTVASNFALKGAQLGSVAIVPNTNIALVVDQVNNRLLIVPLPN